MKSDGIRPAVPRKDEVARSGSWFREVFEREYDYVWASLRRLGTRESDLEDLAHEVFLRVHRKLGAFDTDRPLRPWLFAFAFRVASEHRRLHRNKLEEPRADLDVTHAAPASSGQREARDLVRRGLDVLTDTTRAVFIMYELDGFTMNEIADALGIPLNTAYSRLRLGRDAFVARVRELEGKEA
jgi:RNA polymerase sigma-70 factor (ECF subfamily)